MVSLLAVLTLAATAALCAMIVVVRDSLASTASLLLRSEAMLADAARRLPRNVDLAEASALAEDAVEGGTQAVRFVHRGIAAIPFAILEALPPARPAARAMRMAHDLIAGSVYGAISLANRGVGRVLRGTGQPVPARKKP